MMFLPGERPYPIERRQSVAPKGDTNVRAFIEALAGFAALALFFFLIVCLFPWMVQP
jgi:hypothetical protein